MIRCLHWGDLDDFRWPILSRSSCKWCSQIYPFKYRCVHLLPRKLSCMRMQCSNEGRESWVTIKVILNRSLHRMPFPQKSFLNICIQNEDQTDYRQLAAHISWRKKKKIWWFFTLEFISRQKPTALYRTDSFSWAFKRSIKLSVSVATFPLYDAVEFT